MTKNEHKYHGYITNNDPLIYKKEFELSFKCWDYDVSAVDTKFTLALVTLTFQDPLSSSSIKSLTRWYNLGLAINGREYYLDIINDDFYINHNREVSFSCSIAALKELLGLGTLGYN